MNWKRLRPWFLLLFTAAGIGCVSFYTYNSAQLFSIGFPLDDAWIHQTYARNLATTGIWFFQDGAPSTGSTAPLWTVLLVPGYFLNLSPVIWSGALGTVLLITTALTAGSLLEIRIRPGTVIYLVGGIVILLDWHLLWAAVSGMETMAACCLVVIFFYILERFPQKSFLLGVILGVGVWIRPDLITLGLPLGIAIVLNWKSGVKKLFTYFLSVGAGLCIFVVPYLWLNKALSGAWWPSTFYAKQAEYAVRRSLPLAGRILRQFIQPLIGAGGILLPGIIINVGYTLRRKKWSDLAPHLWIATYLTLFAVRLPVTYQHGRYAMPVIPIVLVLGVEGLLRVVKWNADRFCLRAASRVWSISSMLVLLIFMLKGASAFAQDVAIIESEMVETASWISENTGTGDLVAAHDIGAIGYFSDRRLIDLAGLISPEVIPILRNEQELAGYMNERGVDYLVTFPDWYPDLTADAEPFYQTDTDFSIKAGGENMAVYIWPTVGFAP